MIDDKKHLCITSRTAFAYLFTPLRIKKKKNEICAYVSAIMRIKTFSHITVLCRGNQMEQTTWR